MEINLIKATQGLACGFLDVFMWLVTKMGEEIMFLLVFVGIYLLYNKLFAVKYSFYYLISVAANAFVKMVFQRPRPYMVSSEVANRLPATSEFSFPSGHTQAYFVQSTTSMIEINKKSRKKSLKISFLVAFIILGLLMMVSRMYWGQHYISDTVVAAIFGIIIPFILDWLLKICPKKLKEIFTLDLIFKLILVGSIIGFFACLGLELAYDFWSTKIYMFLGVFTSFSLGYLLDKKYIKYEPKANWKKTILKALMLYVVLVGLYLILDLILPISGFVLYLVYLFLGAIGFIVLPIVFNKIFNKEKMVEDGQDSN